MKKHILIIVTVALKTILYFGRKESRGSILFSDVSLKTLRVMFPVKFFFIHATKKEWKF